MPKNIVLCIDGTWNSAAGDKEAGPTNVSKLHDRVETGGSAMQSRDYLTGIGTEDTEKYGCLALRQSRRLVERISDHAPGRVRRAIAGLSGFGTRRRITLAYQILSCKYEPGDHVYLFGFSRGALAARSLAGFVDAVGLLLKDKVEFVEEAYVLYEQRRDPDASALRGFLHRKTGSRRADVDAGTQLPVYFLGVWDTVAALGLPWSLSAISAHWTRRHQTELPFNVTYARQALSLHELRPNFPPLLWQGRHPDSTNQNLKQVWFPGAHADVGGGYRVDATDHIGSWWSDIALDWMANEAKDAGLVLKDAPAPTPQPSRPCLHHEFRGKFKLAPARVRKELRGWSRLAPGAIETFGVHPSALDRLLFAPRPYYPYSRFVNKRLKKADALGLQMHFELSYRPGAPPPQWLRDIRPEIAWCPERLRSFITTPGTPSEDECGAFRQAFCVWLLCSEEDVADVVRKLIEDTSVLIEAEYLHPDHHKLNRLHDWCERLSCIAEEIGRASSDLPQSRITALDDLEERIKTTGIRLRLKVIEMTVRRGIQEPMPLSRSLRIPKSPPAS